MRLYRVTRMSGIGMSCSVCDSLRGRPSREQGRHRAPRHPELSQARCLLPHGKNVEGFVVMGFGGDVKIPDKGNITKFCHFCTLSRAISGQVSAPAW